MLLLGHRMGGGIWAHTHTHTSGREGLSGVEWSGGVCSCRALYGPQQPKRVQTSKHSTSIQGTVYKRQSADGGRKEKERWDQSLPDTLRPYTVHVPYTGSSVLCIPFFLHKQGSLFLRLSE